MFWNNRSHVTVLGVRVMTREIPLGKKGESDPIPPELQVFLSISCFPEACEFCVDCEILTISWI